jgi:uncharacterized protein YndB with AHSA1/START domain
VSVATEYRDLCVEIPPPFDAVEVALRAPVPAADAWRAISEPPQIRRWLGTVWTELTPGRSARLDFGDGDFFDLVVREFEPPRRLEYAWRFLGIGPEDLISWRVAEIDECDCEIHVRDHEPERTREASLALAAGWADFLGRLTRFLATGRWSRYDWRDDVDASLEVPVPVRVARSLLDPASHAKWLPVNGPLREGTAFALEGGGELEVRSVRRVDSDTLDVVLALPAGAAATRCLLGVRPRTRDAVLEVHQSGFRGLPVVEGGQKRLRSVVVRTWIGALERGLGVAVARGNSVGG